MAYTTRISYNDGTNTQELDIMAKAVASAAVDGTSVILDDDGKLAMAERYSAQHLGMLKATADSMTTGNTLSTDGAPNIRFPYTLNFHALITDMGEITISFGTGAYNCGAIKIDSSSLFFYNTDYDMDDGATGTTYTHGLTFADFITVTIIVNEATTTDGIVAKVRIRTNGGEYTSDATKWRGSYGELVVTAVSGTYTNCVATLGSVGFDKDVWMFYDSYGDYVIKALSTYNVSNYMLDAWSGRTTSYAYRSLVKALALGMPKIVIWGMGMNDADSSTAINGEYQSYTKAAASLCESNNIKFIPCTIPNCPSTLHTFKNTWIRSNYDEYIDMAIALGANEEGSSWFDDLKESGSNVHPSDTGKYIITEVLLQEVPLMNDTTD